MAAFLHPVPRKRSGAARARERGGIAVLSFVVLAVLVGFAALGFDLAYIRLARFEMKNATDAAAHAAMMLMRETSMNTTQATTAAINVAAKNYVLGYPVVLTSSDVVFGVWDYDTSTFSAGTSPYNAVQVTGHKADLSASDGTVKTTFGSALGVGSAALTQVSTAAFRTRSLMFEMDITGSFLTNSCAFDAAKAADLAFGDAMFAARSPKDKLGLDVFVGSAMNVTPLQNIQTNWSSIRADWVGDGKSSLDHTKTSGLSVCTKAGQLATGDWTCGGPSTAWPNLANIKGGIANPTCWAADSHYLPPTSTVQVYGGTNIGSGIAAGIAALNATSKTYEVRSIVVFTDGGPLCCEAAAGGAICPQPGPCCADVTAGACTDNGTGACACSQAVKDYGTTQAALAYNTYGIDVYVLAFGNTPGWITYAHSLPQGRGFALDTNDSTQLTANLTKIANAIPIALVK